jgi:hypothetical protein
MAIILTGMHRSGTSMFARYMHESGICMGENFYIDTTANRYGHYEDMDFLNLQRKELSRHFKGEDWLVYSSFSLSDDFVEQAQLLFDQKAERNSGNPWGWKDPRTTLFLDFWQQTAPDTRFIFMVRHPDEVLNSLCRLLKTRWSQKEKSKYLQAYTHYNTALLNFARENRSRNMAFVSFTHLLDNPEKVLEKVNATINTSFDYRLFQQLFDVNAISSDAFIPSIFIGKQLDEARAVYGELKGYFV